MRSLKYCLILLLSLCLFSCADVNRNLEEMIPSTSRGVVRIDVRSVLQKGAILDKEGNVTIPPQLREAIDATDGDSPVSDFFSLVKKIGLDTDACLYGFIPQSIFSYATLVALDDADVARAEIEKRMGQKFQQIEKVDFLRSGATSYVIDGDVLFMGVEAKEMADAHLALAARSYLHKSEPGIETDEAITEALHKENDVNAYFSMKGIQKMIAASETISEKVKKFPILTLFTDSDIKALSLHMNFQPEGAMIEACIKADAKSDYCTLLEATMAKADASFLKVIPTSMNFILSLSVKGENLMKLDQIKKSVNLLSNLPAMDRLDFRSIVAAIDGPLAVAISSGDGMNLSSIADDNWNVAIAAKTRNSAAIVQRIVDFAGEMGQDDYVKNGRHLFSYEGMPVYLGEQDGVVYAIRLDHELEEEFYYDVPDVKERFASSPFGFYAKIQNPKGDAFLNFGFNSPTEAGGMFYSLQESNPVVTFLSILCQASAKADEDTASDSLY
ncbi:MAG: DUF4836 family protein [Bacteroidales bacterium]|nr:DUF4836 family protein [Bacteroidales bacterium]